MIYKLIYEVLTLVKRTIHFLQGTTAVLGRDRTDQKKEKPKGRD